MLSANANSTTDACEINVYVLAYLAAGLSVFMRNTYSLPISLVTQCLYPRPCLHINIFDFYCGRPPFHPH